MNEMFRSYEVARKIFSILEFVGWCVVVLGLIAGFVMVEGAGRYASDGQQFLLFLSGASGSIVGLFLVGLVQFFRSGVDSAEYAQQGLYVAREQLDVSRQLLKKQREDRHSFADLSTTDEQSAGAAFGSFASSSPERSDDRSSVVPQEHSSEVLQLDDGSQKTNGQAVEGKQTAHAAIDQKPDTPSLEAITNRSLEDLDENPSIASADIREEEVKLDDRSNKTINQAVERMQSTQLAIEQKLDTPSFAPQALGPMPVELVNGKDEEVPRSFAELRATRSSEGVGPQRDAQAMAARKPVPAPFESEELTLTGAPENPQTLDEEPQEIDGRVGEPPKKSRKKNQNKKP